MSQPHERDVNESDAEGARQRWGNTLGSWAVVQGELISPEESTGKDGGREGRRGKGREGGREARDGMG